MELGRINASVFTPLCLGVFDTPINQPVFETAPERKGKKKKEGEKQSRNKDLHLEAVWKRRVWLQLLLTAGICAEDVCASHR